MSARWIWVGFHHLISNKHKWDNCFIKNAHKIWSLPHFIWKKQPIFSLFLMLSRRDAYSYPISRTWYGSHTMMAKPIRALELHYPMIQFLIIALIKWLFPEAGKMKRNLRSDQLPSRRTRQAYLARLLRISHNKSFIGQACRCCVELDQRRLFLVYLLFFFPGWGGR